MRWSHWGNYGSALGQNNAFHLLSSIFLDDSVILHWPTFWSLEPMEANLQRSSLMSHASWYSHYPPTVNQATWLTLTKSMEQKWHSTSSRAKLYRPGSFCFYVLLSLEGYVISQAIQLEWLPGEVMQWERPWNCMERERSLTIPTSQLSLSFFPNKTLEMWVKPSWTFWTQLASDHSFMRSKGNQQKKTLSQPLVHPSTYKW